jgi:uncharacterized protein (TIGR03066 family)
MIGGLSASNHRELHDLPRMQMTKLRWLVGGVLACVLTCEIDAEEKKPDNAKLIIGVWELIKGEEEVLPKGSLVEFTKDGKLKLTLKVDGKDLVIEGTYKVAGDKLEMTVKAPDDTEMKQSVTIKNLTQKELTLTDVDGNADVLTRTK